jgi:hypothetical protein
MIDEKLIGKNLERSGRGLFKVTLRNLSGGTEVKLQKSESEQLGSRPKYNLTPSEYKSKALSLYQTDRCFSITECMI